MHPIHYVKSHWHAMILGAVVWHFVGGYVTSTVSGAVNPNSNGN